MKKILIITYYWPPSGGAGVQRWLKFAKYLPEYGWQPVILTVDPRYATYPQRDESLEGEIDPQCLVYRTKSFELYNLYRLLSGKKEVPYGGFANELKEGWGQKISKFLRGNFLLPDPRRGWNKYAVKKAIELIGQYHIDTIVTTSPPHSTQLIGLELKRKLKVKWVADLRDPWTDIYYYSHFRQTALARSMDRRMERKVIEMADRIVTVSQDFKRIFVEKSPLDIASKTVVIPNGFDEEDFDVLPVSRETKKVLTYIGTISEAYDLSGLIKALSALTEQSKEGLKIRFVGNVPRSVEQRLLSTGLSVEFTGYVDHARAVEYLLLSDMLLLVIPKVDNNGGILPGKVFEYLAARKPILAIGPGKGDLDQLIKETKCGMLFDYQDDQGMLRFISGQLSDQGMEAPRKEITDKYSRKQLTGRIVQLLNGKN